MAREISGTESFNNGAYEIPTNERGQDVFQILEEFMERMATHNHTGDDSLDISLNISKDIENIVIVSWTDMGDGRYRATLNVPVSTTFDNSLRTFFDGSDQIFPTVEKIDNASYYIYTNEQFASVKVVTL